jgi:hypothetical protein
VLAYQGAMAFVYVADRSSCPKPDQDCNWKKPARYKEDVLELAEAFWDNNKTGKVAKDMKGALDMILVRKLKPGDKNPPPFQVYVGKGQTQEVSAYLAAHPHQAYVDVPGRLKDLAVGPYGERAGDILLIAHNGDREDKKDRYYFASTYHSWHGSPGKRDSEVSLIVANKNKASQAIAQVVRTNLGPRPRQQNIAKVLMALRYRTASTRADKQDTKNPAARKAPKGT